MQAWGVDMLSLPAGDVRRMTVAMNAANCVTGYLKSAPNTVTWTQHHPEAWAFVSSMMTLRRQGTADNDS